MTYRFHDSYALPKFDVDKIVDHFGGEGMLIRELMLAGYDAPDRQAINQWRRRNRVPSHWLVALIYLSYDLGKPLDLRALLGRLRKKPPRPNRIRPADALKGSGA